MSEYIKYVNGQAKNFNSRLVRLDIELTERCNNNCIHCCINLPAKDALARRREMTTDQVKDILLQAVELGCLQVNFTGGEPLLRPDFEELYLFARRIGMKVMLFTNGRLISKRLADLFARVPPLEEIEITVYGMHKESYEAVTRAPGSFNQFWRGVNRLLEYNVPFIVKSALLPPNMNEMGEFEKWAQAKIPWMTKRPSYALFFDLRQRRDSAEKNQEIKSLRNSPETGLAVIFRDEASQHKWTPELAKIHLRPTGSRLFTCGACKGHELSVDAYGRAQPCIGIRAAEMTYNVTGAEDRVSLLEVLDRFSQLAAMSATNPAYQQRCAVCFLKGLCQQCPARSWAEHGTFDTPIEYYCNQAHAHARHLGWLGENEHSWDVGNWMERIENVSKVTDD